MSYFVTTVTHNLEV